MLALVGVGLGGVDADSSAEVKSRAWVCCDSACVAPCLLGRWTQLGDTVFGLKDACVFGPTQGHASHGWAGEGDDGTCASYNLDWAHRLRGGFARGTARAGLHVGGPRWGWALLRAMLGRLGCAVARTGRA